MTKHYDIQKGSSEQRDRVESLLFGLENLDPEIREQIITAWITSWLCSPYVDLSDAPYGPLAPDYLLMDHVREVVQIGLVLAHEAKNQWNETCDLKSLIAVLLMHDVDKPLMFLRTEAGIEVSPLASTLPHGVVGSMIAYDLGLPQQVVDIVATHSGQSPFHSLLFESYILHYADMFASDRAILAGGGKPFFQK